MNQKRCIVCCLIAKLYYSILWRRYKFDYWHASASWYCRPYKKQVVELASSVSPEAVMEIGCGLGDIISRIKAQKRFAFDIDAHVIDAAKKLRSDIIFENVSLFDTQKLIDIVDPTQQVDLLLMVNWPHNVSFDDIFSCVNKIKLNLGLRYLIIDEIKQGNIGFKYNHSSEFLLKLGTITRTVEAVDGFRLLHLIDISNNL